MMKTKNLTPIMTTLAFFMLIAGPIIIGCSSEPKTYQESEPKTYQESDKHKLDRLWREGQSLHKASKYSESKDKFEQALEICRRISNHKDVGRLLGNLGLTNYELGNYQKAKEYLEKALEIAKKERDEEDVIKSTLNNLGRVSGKLSDHSSAIEYFKEGLEIARKGGDKEGEGDFLCNVGWSYESMEYYTKATDFLDQALAIARKVGNKITEGICLHNLGIIYGSFGNYIKAKEYHDKSLRIAKDIGNKQLEALSLATHGDIYWHFGKFNEAKKYWEWALLIDKEIENKSGQSYRLGELGRAYAYFGDFSKAIENCNEALNIAKKTGERSCERTQLNNLGYVYRKSGNYEKAKVYYEQSLSISRKLGQKGSEGANLGGLGIVYSELGDNKKGEKYLDSALSIAKKLKQKKNEGKWSGYLGNVYVNLGDFDKAIGHYKQALSIANKIEDKEYEGEWIKGLETASIARDAEIEKQTLPAELTIVNSLFQDNDSFCYHDKILNAGEEGRIIFTIKNMGKGRGFNVLVDIKNDNSEIETLGFMEELGSIQPEEAKTVTIPIKAGLGLKNGKAAFLIQAKEKRGYHSQKVKLAVQTSALIPPKLKIQSVEINDGNIGQARGNGNGIPENDETIELVAYIKNSGSGDALGTTLDLASINSGLNIIKPKAKIGVISPGKTVKGKLVFSIPRTFKANKLRYKLKVDDVRGADSYSRQFASNFKRLAPVLAYDHRVYDGNSANSKGNRNGKIENGETVEIEIFTKNKGDLEAHDVKVGLDAPRGLSFNKNKASIGTILPNDRGEKKSFILPIPRTYQKSKIDLDLKISQADFPSLNRTLTLKMNPVRPKLTFTHKVIGSIQQGQSPVLEVIVRNEGRLDADEVKVSVDIATPGIDIRTREKECGRLPAGATVTQSFNFTIKRSASPGKLPIKVNITQTDFPKVTDTLAFNIEEEGVIEVAVQGSKPVARSYSQPAGYNMPPSIVIVSPTSKKSFKPDITLVTDVADDKEIRRIMVKLNGQIITDNNFRGIDIEGSADSLKKKQLRRRLKLDSGENRITVVAYDNENQISEESITVSYQKEKGEIWAVVIGIGAYKNKSLKLNYTVPDALSMRDYLIKDFGVPSDHVTVLLDQEATLERVRRELGIELMRKAGKEDQVIIYFAGHGAPEQEAESPDGDGFEKYLLPYDVKPEYLYSTALPMEEISKIFRRIKAERLVFLADACFSGASGGDIFRARTAPISDKFWERISKGKGRVILSASSASEVSQERKDLGHGVFTYYLLKGLRGKADWDGDGFIDTEEIYRYVSKEVPQATGQQQNPIKKGEVEGQIVLGRVK